MGGGEVIKKGWLIKSPPLDSGGMKAWRKRFFCLRSSKVLEYYKSVDGDLKGVVNLEDCKAVHADLSHKKYKHVFDIETRDRTYYFVASSAEDMKNWVDTICHVCSFSLQSNTAVIGESTPIIGASQTMPANMPSGQPLITSPNTMGGGVSFNERFKPAQNGATAESLYSLATESGAEIKRQLTGGGEVPSGIPLTEALASKGIGNVPPRSATMDPGGPSFVYPMSGLPDYSFFSPRPAGVNDPQGIYSLAQNSHGKDRSATLMPGARPDEQYGSHRQLQASASLGGSYRDGHGLAGPSPSSSAGPTVGSTLAAVGRTDTAVPSMGPGGSVNRAQQLENGYMAPRKIARPPAYDYPPFGPPRPAEPFVGSGSTPTRQPHSALLKSDERGVTPSVPTPSPRNSGGRPPTYINMKNLNDNLPPVIDRSTKPTPPTIDRTLKPSGYSPPKNTPPKYEGEDTDDDSDSSESSPEQVKKTSSIDSSFSVADLPKPTSRTTQYTQVEIKLSSNRQKLSPDEEVDDISKRAPIPVPREHPVPKPRNRVNYSDIDLTATATRGESRTVSRSPTLRTAEQEKLRDTEGYINVNRDGEIDEDTDPGYYTHMRNLEGDDVDRPSLEVLKEFIPPRS